MERELFRSVYETAYHLGKRRQTKHVVFPDWKIVVVFLWAALHDRPTCWACDRLNWPEAARTLELPSASTMSRRLRRPAVQMLMDMVEQSLRRRLPTDRLMFIDAKPLPVGSGSKDPDVAAGYAGGGIAKGYKLHAICDSNRLPVAWVIRPMNENESIVAPQLIEQLTGNGILVGDNAYDRNYLYDLAGERGWQLLAPRRENTELGHVRHSRWRIIALEWMSQAWRNRLMEARKGIERFFGHLVNLGCGLSPLPAWVRRDRRVTQWVQAKLIIYLAYRIRSLEPAA